MTPISERVPARELPPSDARTCRDILLTEERAKRDRRIPLPHISMDEAIYSGPRAKFLGQNIIGEGQRMRVYLRARLEENTVVYDVIDGFHRTGGLIEANRLDTDHALDNKINATVEYGMSDEELYDQRILALNPDASVNFARIAKWMDMAYRLTPFAKKLTIEQAFEEGSRRGKKTNISTLTSEESIKLKEWIDNKCEIWKKTPKDMATILQIIQNADPAIVDMVRTSTTGTKREPYSINRTDLTIITRALKNNYAAQKAIANLIATRGSQVLNRNEVQRLIDHIAPKLTPEMDEAAIAQLLTTIPLETVLFEPLQHTKNKQKPKINPLQEEVDGLNQELEGLKRKARDQIAGLKEENTRLKKTLTILTHIEDPNIPLTPTQREALRRYQLSGLGLDLLRDTVYGTPLYGYTIDEIQALILTGQRTVREYAGKRK